MLLVGHVFPLHYLLLPTGFFLACADAYLTPHIKQYVKSFSSGFQDIQVSVNDNVPFPQFVS